MCGSAAGILLNSWELVTVVLFVKVIVSGSFGMLSKLWAFSFSRICKNEKKKTLISAKDHVYEIELSSESTTSG